MPLRAMGTALILLVLAVTGAEASAPLERDLALRVARFAREAPDATRRIGERIFANEAAGRVAGLTYWAPGEQHASLGIGHFIWYPEGGGGPYHESFPDLLAFMAARGVDLPAWLAPGSDCPWPTRADFLAAHQAPRMLTLRQLLADTIPEQVAFLIDRLARALPAVVAAAAPDRRARLRAQLDRVLLGPDGAISPSGLYALVDYTNFKGEGIDPAERYRGEGWGLLQVLLAMRGRPGDGRAAFAEAAAAVLERRVALAPPERPEERWLDGWHRRVATYADPGRSDARSQLTGP